MGPKEFIELAVLFGLLLLSAFFSSAETALTTVNLIRMRTLSESGEDKRADRVIRITDNSAKMLSAILIGNNLVNISASSLATALAIHLWNDFGAGIATGVLTLLILIFGEISPKRMAAIHADEMALKISGIIEALMYLLTPVIIVINFLSRIFLKLLGVDPDDKGQVMTEDELRTIVDVSQETGVIEDEEREMIHNVFDFGDAEAREVMVPRIDMTFVDVNASYTELMDIFRRDKFTRLPVYEDNTDTVIGILNIKDVFLAKSAEDFHIRDYMREPFFTFEHKNTSDLFVEMRQSSISLAIVLDEFGSTAGLLTLEDLLEEIVGEIRDEYDTDEVDDVTVLNEKEFVLQGSANLEDVSNELDLNFHSEDYDTVGGFCLEVLDHVPVCGESFTTEDGTVIRIETMDKNRIETIRVVKQ